MDKKYRKHLPGLGATTLALSLLAGCASHNTQPAKADDAKVKQFAGRGYLTDDHYNVTTTFATWVVRDRSFDVAFTVPAKPGKFPLLIYLPALGEGRSAGENLRTAWAQAGYAVMSVQLLVEDAKAWSTTYARSGEFSALAHDRYSAKAMTERFDALRTVLVELEQRPFNEVPLDRIDFTRTAIIGYDIGAYTAMIAAGEDMRGVNRPALPIPIKAVVALSPYSSFSGAAFADRYSSIKGAVLSVTSDNDTDPLGMVVSPAVRKAPFQYMPAGDKYLLTLSDISHAVIGGSMMNTNGNERSRGAGNGDSGGPNESQGGGEGKHGGRRHGGNGQARETGQEESPAFGGDLSPTSRAIGLTAIQGVTTAFLDSYVKGDAFAQEWLDKDVRRWLGPRGQIEKK
jgi:dienelactone hydrolase